MMRILNFNLSGILRCVKLLAVFIVVHRWPKRSEMSSSLLTEPFPTSTCSLWVPFCCYNKNRVWILFLLKKIGLFSSQYQKLKSKNSGQDTRTCVSLCWCPHGAWISEEVWEMEKVPGAVRQEPREACGLGLLFLEKPTLIGASCHPQDQH